MKHPAKYSNAILDVLTSVLTGYEGRVLDPFAGTGRIHLLSRPGLETWGVELEREWAGMHPRTICANALSMPFPPKTFQAIVTSPTYGNRLADHHNARDGSVRRSYTHDLGHALHPTNSGALHFGMAYRAFHQVAWAECNRVLQAGLFIVNVSDFISLGERVPVVDFHVDCLRHLGLVEAAHLKVPTPRLRYGANRGARVEEESVLVYRKEAPCPRPHPFMYRRSSTTFTSTSSRPGAPTSLAMTTPSES